VRERLDLLGQVVKAIQLLVSQRRLFGHGPLSDSSTERVVCVSWLVQA